MRRVSPPRSSTVQSTLAVVSAALAVLAAVRPQWLEALGLDPDHGSGFVEWAVPIGLALVAVALLLAARHSRARHALGQTG